MQIPSSCSWHDDVAWGVATVLAVLLILPLIPIVVAAGAVSEIARRVREW